MKFLAGEKVTRRGLVNSTEIGAPFKREIELHTGDVHQKGTRSDAP